MSRSIYKGPYIESGLLRKIKNMTASSIDFGKTTIKTYSRRSTIIPSFVGKMFEIHNGIRFTKVYITESMIGHKLGEFSPTRVLAKHGDNKHVKDKKMIKKTKRK